MNYKLEYISRLFQRTSKKRIENYVITRLWHKLDNDDIKMVPQQYVHRQEEKYALTDVYFPQFRIHVEVNEPAHYDSEGRIARDKMRQNQIENNTGHRVFVIDCRESLSGIHNQVDQVINAIQEEHEIQKQKGRFKGWDPNREHNPLYWKSKNIFSIEDEVCLKTIEAICELFGADANKTKRGYLRRGTIAHPKNSNVELWWPSATSRQGWQNSYDEKNQLITETHSDTNVKEDHFRRHFNTKAIRYVFYHYKDVLGFKNYKFKGVFAYDSENSNEEVGTIWKRIGTQIQVEPNEYK